MRRRLRRGLLSRIRGRFRGRRVCGLRRGLLRWIRRRLRRGNMGRSRCWLASRIRGRFRGRRVRGLRRGLLRWIRRRVGGGKVRRERRRLVGRPRRRLLRRQVRVAAPLVRAAPPVVASGARVLVRARGGARDAHAEAVNEAVLVGKRVRRDVLELRRAEGPEIPRVRQEVLLRRDPGVHGVVGARGAGVVLAAVGRARCGRASARVGELGVEAPRVAGAAALGPHELRVVAAARPRRLVLEYLLRRAEARAQVRARGVCAALRLESDAAAQAIQRRAAAHVVVAVRVEGPPEVGAGAARAVRPVPTLPAVRYREELRRDVRWC